MITRRKFLQSSLSVALVPLLPRLALSATTVRVRPSWETFRSGPMFPLFLSTIASMRANKQSADPASWLYWSDVHKNACPHGLPYFLAWHRGFLKRFEMQLRKISGDKELVLPYWDYYRDPYLPPEFTDDTSPLWHGHRVGDNVRDALTLHPFDDTLIRFPRGRPDAFEPAVETAPHNPVHNLIGGAMANVSISPQDPIFWVHHANIDRLWVAWVNAGGSRRMPARTNSYWSGYFHYGTAVPSLAKVKTYATTDLAYRYEDETVPQMPPLYGSSTVVAGPDSAFRQVIDFGQDQPISLDEHPSRIDVQLAPDQRHRVRSMLLDQPGGQAAAGGIRIVLDDVRLTARGGRGGYFYKVFLGLPAPPGGLRAPRSYLLGTLGAFEITAARMRMRMGTGGAAGGTQVPRSDGPLQIVYPAGDALQELRPDSLDQLEVSFVRVGGGSSAPQGPTITVGAFRMDA